MKTQRRDGFDLAWGICACEIVEFCPSFKFCVPEQVRNFALFSFQKTDSRRRDLSKKEATYHIIVTVFFRRKA